MSTLHIFNPEHDIALAWGKACFTAPHAGRQLRRDLGLLPVLWATDEDFVLVDDIDVAIKGLKRLFAQLSAAGVTWRPKNQLERFVQVKKLGLHDVLRVEPWGWDMALRAQLLRAGLLADLLPTEQQVERIRAFSHRRLSAKLLPLLQGEGTLGVQEECYNANQVSELLERNGRLVLKAPWSSSGRGLRFLDVQRTPLSMQAGWLKNVMAAQGSVMAEPYYDKVKDFGMEFWSDGKGAVRYLGLSFFHTQNGAYTGNMLATESWKRQQLERYIPASWLDRTQRLICQHTSVLFAHEYEGPFGVDMMLVAGNGSCRLHPCVELNLRRTMGHVALSLSQRLNPMQDDEMVRVMRIAFEDNQYKFKIQKL